MRWRKWARDDATGRRDRVMRYGQTRRRRAQDERRGGAWTFEGDFMTKQTAAPPPNRAQRAEMPPKTQRAGAQS